MPLTQEKRLDSNFSNNNDHSYLHKKFKKMASTISVFPNNLSKVGDTRHKETIGAQNACSVSIPNGSIAAAHPEIEKIRGRQDREHLDVQAAAKNVQTNFNDENSRISNVNNFVQVTGQTGFTDEFSNKTENHENDFIRENYNGAVGGRYICPYCKLSCAKPSVLQKHIRAHTNERPYPCVPCGFAFKTKSNLYKHRRSRTHALRLQGADVPVTINDDDLSGGSESDTPTSISETGSDVSSVRLENFDTYKNNSPGSPENQNECMVISSPNGFPPTNDNKLKSIYKPKFRAGASFYKETDKEKPRKSISSNADFLTEHISKIISDNEAIVDVIETPLQKKYSKIIQIAESKQFMSDMVEIKSEPSPLNLTKTTNEAENSFRKRSHSESFSLSDHQKHPLNPEGSIIKDLLLKTKMNGLVPASGELPEGPWFICPLCQIIYRSADNLETHRLYYCKGSAENSNSTSDRKDVKITRPDNIYFRSNSVNVRLPETSSTSFTKTSNTIKSTSAKMKPENLVILKPESNDIIAPLPSPGPLLGNTRLVDTRIQSDFSRKNDSIKIKPTTSPKRRIDCSSDMYSPRLVENMSPRSVDAYSQPKLRCIDTGSSPFRSLDEMSPHMRNNSTSLQMFGGEVKIMDHSGSTTTLRIEPNKNQLSPILIQQNLSPSKIGSDPEASSVVVRSGLHSGGTIMHNPPTPKEILGTPQPHTPRISISTPTVIPSSNLPKIHDITTHFQFPPLSAITAYNPLTLPPLSPSSSPSGASTILHGGKLIPHVPGIPGPNTPGIFMGNANNNSKTVNSDVISKNSVQTNRDDSYNNLQPGKGLQVVSKYDTHSARNSRSPNLKLHNVEAEKHIVMHESYNSEIPQYVTPVPIIKVKNVDESKIYSMSNVKQMTRPEMPVKRNVEGFPRMQVSKENLNITQNKLKIREKPMQSPLPKVLEPRPEKIMRSFNFENLITKAEIYNNQIQSSPEVQQSSNNSTDTCESIQNERSETLYFQKNVMAKSLSEERKPKFLRPTTLPLKPGTFTPKRHHGITPNANTMPLVSPETPRPAKAYGQLYLNGNAYTYLGLKCSTKVFYCTINRPQPTYVPNQHFLSMYSNWQLLSELTPDPLGLSASSAMSLYDSRHRPQSVSVSVIKQDLILTHSSQWKKTSKENKQALLTIDLKKVEDGRLQLSDNLTTPKKELTGGFESNEEYTYVRGRGRGRYVCSECGIRCKKPSMLKKHIRTHTDVRPYTCIHCAFSFKTKGNLTKHMKSKAHYKKCCELGINPNEGNDLESAEMAQCSGETDDDTDSDGDEGNEGETESSDTEICKSRLPEHEAAHCLLSLGGSRPSTSATPGLITSARPTTYPYSPTDVDTALVEITAEKINLSRHSSIDSSVDPDCEPMDLSKNDVKTPNIPEIPTARESSVLASLASNTAKLPQAQNQWSNGEPMLHTYLTERALLDSKIKQSQLTCTLSKLKNIELNEKYMLDGVNEDRHVKTSSVSPVSSSHNYNSDSKAVQVKVNDNSISLKQPLSRDENVSSGKMSPVPTANNIINDSKRNTQVNTNAENAKHVVSEYLKQARFNHIKSQEDVSQSQNDNLINEDSTNLKSSGEENLKHDDISSSDSEIVKLPSLDHDAVATKVVIGVGGVAFKVTKGKDFENSSYSLGRLMEDGRRVCDFCNKTFTKPSQLKLHLNIHYMERPFKCGVCAVSFRTRGHLQKHERSGSHHNKVSMTSTFGAATSFNPRPFRCSDCNIAFRIHGHLAKHLRSKMHVMRLECLFKLPFGTFTEIERAGVSLTDIDTTDCASSLASLQTLARKLHEKDPTKLEYRDPNGAVSQAVPSGRDPSDYEDNVMCENMCDAEKDIDIKTIENSEGQDIESRGNCSATDI